MFLAAWTSQMNCSAYANRLCVYSVLCHSHSNQRHNRIEVWVINRNSFDLETWDKISVSIQVTWIQITPWCRISPWHAELDFALQTGQKEQRCGLVCMPGWVLCCEWNKILNLWAWCRFSIRMLLCFYKQLDCRFHFPPTVIVYKTSLNPLLFRVNRLDGNLILYFGNGPFLVLEGSLKRQNHTKSSRHAKFGVHLLERIFILASLSNFEDWVRLFNANS